MMVFLVLVCLSVAITVLTSILFVRVGRSSVPAEREAPAAAETADTLDAFGSSRFFASQLVAARPRPSRFPIEVLLSQIESHVRCEQAAAEAFLAVPTSERLHSPTASPLLQ
ncbi:MAG: hypothetical protein ACE15D_06405 [Candidatus Eisenbacteria bacterium]|nr:hypothetical protein [Candidatus Eisenbacteria bacterium]